MTVYMLWFGGSGYSPPETDRDTEEYESLGEARRAFGSRLRDPYYPCVSEEEPEEGGPEAWLFFSDPRSEENGPGDPYPDRLLRFGPRGGIRTEHC